MSRLAQAGAETRSTVTTESNLAPDGLMSGSGTKPTTNSVARIVHSSDSRCWICAPSATTTSYVAFGISGGTNNRIYYLRLYFRFNQLPTSTVTIAAFLNAGAGALCSVKMTSAGKLQLWNDRAPAQVGSDSTDTFAINTWYMVTLAVRVPNPAASTGLAEAYYQLTDSGTPVQIASSSTINYVSNSPPGSYNVGVVTQTGLTGTQFFIDDVALNDDQGAAPHNTYPGPGHVLNLMPVADVSIGNWLNGAGGATSLFDAVNGGGGTGTHGAAAGVAPGSATAGTQAKNTGAGVNDPADFTLDSYTAQGITTETIVLVRPIMAFGDDTTGDVTGGVSVVSNPAVAEATQAMTTGVAVATYADKWSWLKGTVQLAPTPTLGTGPVIRIRKASAAGMHVCYTALVVETTPSLAPGNSVAPAVTGIPTVGQVLTSDTGTWSGAPTGYTYQWQRETAVGSGAYSNIAGQTAATKTCVIADIGLRVRCVVTATNATGSTAANSNQVGPVSSGYVPKIVMYGN